MTDTLFTVDLHEPQQARYIYVDEDTGDLHLMIPICGGEEIGIDNTCQSTVELKNFMGGGAPGKSAKDSLALYQKALEQDLQLLPVGNEKRKAKTKRLEQVKEFSKLIEKWKGSIPGGFYNHYTSGIKKLMEARTNFHSMLLRPQVQDTFLRAAGYVFSVKRNDESKLYNTLKSLIFEEYQLVGAKQLLSDAVKKQMATDSNTDPEKRLSNMLKCCEEQCQNLFQIQNVNFHKPSGRYKDQDISLDINFLENILGYDDGEDVLDYLSEVIDACVENLDTMVDLPPHRNLKNPAKRNEEFSVLTQFLLGQINIYCYSKGLSTQNFADAFEVEGDTLYRVLSLRLQQTINLGADIERTIFNVINENYSKFGLSEPLSLERQQEIINKFRRQYKIIYGSPHYDEFMLLDTSIKGKFHTHQGRMTTPLINVLGLENVLDDLPESIASLLDADFPASLSHKNNIEATVELQHADFVNYLIELINNKQYAVAARYLLCKVDDKYYCDYIRLESFPFFETDDAEKIMGLYDKMILESDSTAQIIKTIEMFDLDFNFSVVLDSPRRPLIGLAYLEYCKNNNISLTNKELDVLLEMLTSKECIVDTSKGYIKGILEAYEFYNVSLSRPEVLAILLKNYTDSYSENVKNKISDIIESNKDILSDKRVLEGVLPRLESLRKYYELVEVHGVKLENSNDDATNSFLKLALTSEKSIIRSQEWTNNEMEMAIILIKLGIKFTTIASDAITVDIRYSRYLQIKFKYIQLISTKGINCARVFEDLFENARIKNQNLIDIMKLSRKYGLGVAESNTVSYIKAFWDQDTKYEYWQLEPELMADADILPSLQTAVNKGDLKLINLLINKNQNNINAGVIGHGNKETNLLSWAIINNHTELALDLISREPNLTQVDADSESALHYAVKLNNIDILNELLKHDVDVNQVDRKSDTALMCAIEAKSQDCINALLAHEATNTSQFYHHEYIEVGTASIRKELKSPLTAASHSTPQIFKMIVDITKERKTSITAEHLDRVVIGVLYNDWQSSDKDLALNELRALYESNNFSIARGNLLMHLFFHYSQDCGENHKRMINDIVHENKDLLNHRNGEILTRILEAFIKKASHGGGGLDKYMQLVNANDVSIDMSNVDEKHLMHYIQPPIIWGQQCFDTSLFLLTHGADPNVELTDGSKASGFAEGETKVLLKLAEESHSHEAIVEMMKEKNLDADCIIKIYKSADKYGLDLVKQNCINYFNNISESEKYQYLQSEPDLMVAINILPSINTAVEKQDIELINRLINKDQGNVNAKVKGQDNQETSLLNWAITNNCTELALDLISREANLTQVDASGLSSLHAAVKKDNIVVLNKLLQNGVKINEADSNGKTVLCHAIESKSLDCINKLLSCDSIDISTLFRHESFFKNINKTIELLDSPLISAALATPQIFETILEAINQKEAGVSSEQLDYVVGKIMLNQWDQSQKDRALQEIRKLYRNNNISIARGDLLKSLIIYYRDDCGDTHKDMIDDIVKNNKELLSYESKHGSIFSATVYRLGGMKKFLELARQNDITIDINQTNEGKPLLLGAIHPYTDAETGTNFERVLILLSLGANPDDRTTDDNKVSETASGDVKILLKLAEESHSHEAIVEMMKEQNLDADCIIKIYKSADEHGLELVKQNCAKFIRNCDFKDFCKLVWVDVALVSSIGREAEVPFDDVWDQVLYSDIWIPFIKSSAFDISKIERKHVGCLEMACRLDIALILIDKGYDFPKDYYSGGRTEFAMAIKERIEQRDRRSVLSPAADRERESSPTPASNKKPTPSKPK